MERIEDTFERYRTFVELFPESDYQNSLAGYMDVLNKEKDQLTISNK